MEWLGPKEPTDWTRNMIAPWIIEDDEHQRPERPRIQPALPEEHSLPERSGRPAPHADAEDAPRRGVHILDISPDSDLSIRI